MSLTQLLDMKDAQGHMETLKPNCLSPLPAYPTVTTRPALLIAGYIHGFNNNRQQRPHYFSVRRSA